MSITSRSVPYLSRSPADSFATITQISKLVFHNRGDCHRFWPIHTLLQLVQIYNHHRSEKMQPKFRLIALPKGFYSILTEKEFLKSDHYVIVSAVVHDQLIVHKECNWMNLLFVPEEADKNVVNASSIVSAILKKPSVSALVQVLAAPANASLEPNSIFVSENCYQNCVAKFKLDDSQPIWVKLQEIQAAQQVPQLAKKATVFTINQPHEIPNDIIDEILVCFFETPHILYRNYTYEIALNEQLLGTNSYAKHMQIFGRLRKIYFRCVLLETEDNPFEMCAVVVKNLTTLQQTTSINMAIPRQILHETCPGLSSCPGGLNRYYESLKSSILPFMGKSNNASSTDSVADSCLTSLPVFLLQGSRGSGKTSILNCVARDLGMQILGVDCVDIVSQIASQTEAKIRIALARANTCEPLVVVLFNFEIFGVDNEGREDPRSISMFETELHNLFSLNKHQFPVIVVAVSNQKETKSLIQRIFLETIHVDSLDKEQRFACLKWMHVSNGMTEALHNHRSAIVPLCEIGNESMIDSFNDISDVLHSVADKTPGFFYGDLKLLYNNSVRLMKLKGATLLAQEMFEHNLAVMQSSFSDSLGAPKVPKVLWSDIGGLAKLKEEIQTSIGLPLKHLHLMGKNLRRSGILLYGPPGTGKTLVAKAVATECNLSFLSVQGPELLNMYVGQSEQNVREVFARARSAAPCVIFLDELDSLAPNRGMAGDSGGVMDRVVSQLMTEMNGMTADADPQKQIFILAATNRPDLIDPSLLRPGRFDKLLYVGPCTTKDEKLAILKTQMKRFTLEPSLNQSKIADLLTENMTGADLYSVCSNAWLSAVRRTILNFESGQSNAADLNAENVIVNIADFKTAAANFVPSVSKKDMDYFIKLKASFSVGQ